ncbi:DUF1456 family protein [Sporosarcina sp. PTS2304]|uniref:DUF1456 family protein n=1 Tax=Sporosarcina sp. PTS2304 TaxID=2283194 RepID=UPI000E0DAC53|nr:DUF1456 family protein [Sporosarcina sp. PTS2304]AXH99370.1 DUF1456 family protein [Sporosarcina sp. PTS2304]
MTTNDMLIRLRYALDIKNAEMVEIFKLGGIELTTKEVLAMLKKEEEEQLECSLPTFNAFLNGFIIFKRGPREGKADSGSVVEVEESANNLLLKKVKIALSLTSEDMLDIMEEARVSITKGELGAVLRKVGHRNYKECGDRYARNFLKGLTYKYKE